MEKKGGYGAHVLALPYPSQGHINPMLQFSKRLVSKGLKATLATTRFISPSVCTNSASADAVQIDTISDGFDDGGFFQSESIAEYLSKLEEVGSKTLAELITKHKNLGEPIDCIIYDAFMPWALEVAKKFDLIAAAFFTQMCAVDYIYYYAHNGVLRLPVSSQAAISIPGLPLLELRDMPSFIYVSGSYPAYFEMVLNQFANLEKADYVLINTFYRLEEEAVNSMSKKFLLLTIGPTVPSIYLDNRVPMDKDYGLNLFTLDSSNCNNWLNTKPPASVVYVSFGSMATLTNKQMEELAWGLKATNYFFLWQVRASEESRLPQTFLEDSAKKGLLVKWCPQMEILSHEAIGCFFTHCGWNSTVEALSLGVPMVAMPQWTDQTTDAKFVESVWKVGKRVKVGENGVVGREEIEVCIKEVMEGERGKEMKRNAMKWKELAKEAVSEGGTSDKNIDEFVCKLMKS